jgi:hypothetical protein
MMSASGSTPTLGSFERLRELAPYAALLALPGGSLMALSLWIYRRQKEDDDSFEQCRSAEGGISLEDHSQCAGSPKET